jgi:hypothetical protein
VAYAGIISRKASGWRAPKDPHGEGKCTYAGKEFRQYLWRPRRTPVANPIDPETRDFDSDKATGVGSLCDRFLVI